MPCRIGWVVTVVFRVSCVRQEKIRWFVFVNFAAPFVVVVFDVVVAVVVVVVVVFVVAAAALAVPAASALAAAAVVVVVVVVVAAAVAAAAAAAALEAAGTIEVWKRLERPNHWPKQQRMRQIDTDTTVMAANFIIHPRFPSPPSFFLRQTLQGKPQMQQKGGNNVPFWAPYMRCDSAG